MSAQRYVNDKEYIAFDTETTGLTAHHEVIGFSVCGSEDEAYYIILAKWDVATQKLVYSDVRVRNAAVNLLASLRDKKLIMHNGIYDCMMVESNLRVRLIDSLHTDTLVLAHLLDENRRIGLKELATQYFGEDSTLEQEEMKASVLANGGSLTSSNYELYKGDAHLIGKYGAKDTILTYKLFLTLVPELYDQGLDKFFYEDESMPLLRGPTYELNTTGLAVDIQALTSLKKTLEAECLEAKDYIYQEIAPHIKDKYPGTNKKNKFNIGASQQLAWLLFGKLGLEFGTLTDGGKAACRALGLKLPYTFSAKRDFIHRCEQDADAVIQPEAIVNGKKVRAKKLKQPWAYIACDKKTLAKLSSKYKWIEKLLEYQRKSKILSTYVAGIERGTHYGIIHPAFKQTGTTSGRYSSSDPNFQNLPRDDKRIKACIVARPGKVFVGADQSQLEPRTFAYYSGDKNLMAAFDGTSDFYSVVGMDVYGKHDCTPQKEGSPDAFGVKYKRLRDLSKVIALASAYGATAHQLAPTTGKSIEDTQRDMDSYFEAFPGVKSMMLEAHKLAKEQGYVTNLFGRPRRMPEAKRITKLYGNMTHAELPYEARSLLNLAVNHRIQSTGASIMNRAAIRLHQLKAEAGIDARLVCQVHDSMIVECNEKDAESVAILVQEAMENTVTLEGVSFEAIPRIGKNLAEV
jgi:DNA polymerase I